jgi:hypothetical protein
MYIKKQISYIIIGFLMFPSCSNSDVYKKDLLSGDKLKIIMACYPLGESNDTSSVKDLLNEALDPRIAHHIRFKGVSVNYARLTALQKISGNQYDRKINQFNVDTIATFFFRDWAIKNRYLKDKNEVYIYYFK